MNNTQWINCMIKRYRQDIDDTNSQRETAGYETMSAIDWIAFFHPEEMEDREFTC